MSKYKYEGYGVIRDTEMDFPYHTDDIAELLEEKDQQITDLQSQLAEKEKEIEEYKRICTISHLEDLKIENMLLKSKDQDKISFAVEQLEKVKDIILNERKITSFNFDIFNKGKDTALFWLNEQIDNQINELKGKVEDVKD